MGSFYFVLLQIYECAWEWVAGCLKWSDKSDPHTPSLTLCLLLDNIDDKCWVSVMCVCVCAHSVVISIMNISIMWWLHANSISLADVTWSPWTVEADTQCQWAAWGMAHPSPDANLQHWDITPLLRNIFFNMSLSFVSFSHPWYGTSPP